MAERTRRSVVRGEGGMTLVELVVAMSILSIALVVFGTTLSAVQRSVARQAGWSDNNDRARLGVENIDRHIRSGNVLYAPPSNGSGIIVYTQSNAPTFKTASYSGNQCVQWRVSGGQLQTRWWRSAFPGDWTGAVGSQNPTAWRVVTDGVVNYVVSPNQPVFTIDPDPFKGGRTVNVTLLMNGNYANQPNETVRIQISTTGRNTSYGFLSTACSPTPA
jgi:prepilin-type N-terminal cleavage/methylation domain-containing protein